MSDFLDDYGWILALVVTSLVLWLVIASSVDIENKCRELGGRTIGEGQDCYVNGVGYVDVESNIATTNKTNGTTN